MNETKNQEQELTTISQKTARKKCQSRQKFKNQRTSQNLWDGNLLKNYLKTVRLGESH